VAGDRFNADPQSSYLRRKRQITFNSDTEFEASCVMFRLCPKVIPDAVQPFLQPLVRVVNLLQGRQFTEPVNWRIPR
jgi:hypothetical protein